MSKRILQKLREMSVEERDTHLEAIFSGYEELFETVRVLQLELAELKKTPLLVPETNEEKKAKSFLDEIFG